jgi:indole-3-glycerol phosphate synthase
MKKPIQHSILNQIVVHKLKEVKILKEQKTFQDFEKSIYFNDKCLSLKEKLIEKDFGIIAEFKRKSPSAGKIVTNKSIDFYIEAYQQNGAAAISILTDKIYFEGCCDDIYLNRKNIQIPILRKEFIVDEIQIIESKAIGADAILLIAEILTKKQIILFTTLANSLGLEVVLELNKSSMLEKIYSEVDVIGVNNRDLSIQKTDLNTSFNINSYLPSNICKISESGITNKNEIIALKNSGFHGALIGESILKNKEIKQAFNEFNISENVS